MSNDLRLRQLRRVLEQMGHTHSVEDIVAMCESGAMQSFARGETWVVVQLLDFPQKRVCEIFMVVGTLADTQALYEDVIAYAKDAGCDLVRAYGRWGWRPWARKHGWRDGQQIYTKHLKDT